MATLLSFTETQRFNKWWHYAITGAPVLIVAGVALAFYLDLGKEPGAFWTMGFALGVTLLLFVWFTQLRLETSIDAQGIRVRFRGIPFCHRDIAWQDTKSVAVVTYSPLSDYGGWGVRYGMAGNGWCYNVGGDQGIRILYQNGKPFLVGTQKAEEARQIIQHYFKSPNL